MQKMRLYKLWPHSSALIYGKVLLVNSTNEDLLSIAEVILGVTFAQSALWMCSYKLEWRFLLRTVVLPQVNALELRQCEVECVLFSF